MKKLALMLILAGAAFALQGCFEKAKPEPKTVSWYKAHPDERKSMLARCKENPGKYKGDPDCINAWTASQTRRGKDTAQEAPTENK